MSCRILYFRKQSAINLNLLAWKRKKRQHRLSDLESSTHLPTSEVGPEIKNSDEFLTLESVNVTNVRKQAVTVIQLHIYIRRTLSA